MCGIRTSSSTRSGFVRATMRQHLGAVLGLADDLEAAVGLERLADAVEHEPVVVCNDYAHRRECCRAGGGRSSVASRYPRDRGGIRSRRHRSRRLRARRPAARARVCRSRAQGRHLRHLGGGRRAGLAWARCRSGSPAPRRPLRAGDRRRLVAARPSTPSVVARERGGRRRDRHAGRRAPEPRPDAVPRALERVRRALPRRPAPRAAQHRLPRRHRDGRAASDRRSGSTSTWRSAPSGSPRARR